jgi:transcriptional regulator with XRE-family HTH domain
MADPSLTSELIRAARALLRWEQRHLASASSVSLPTVKRLESRPGKLAAHGSTVAALKRALESAGVEFTNGDQPGVRLRKSAPTDRDSSDNG